MLTIKLIAGICAVLVGVNTVAAIGDEHGKISYTTDVIQDIYYNVNTHTYTAETSKHWQLSIEKSEKEHTDVIVSCNEKYGGKLVKVAHNGEQVIDWKFEGE